ncbi:uncharacterized protein LOC107641944 isoform X1 [Arachis ipaensis]|uniref:uncharacterized protein LOC107641944 isoform X1 n=1 Tax=Arachis ipaensis TaxID=130454 RepID=UPI000A2B7ED3|nr:uncharacterized protein LOC107641944 isoform X1 [Arachis ipaensis]
MAKIHIAIILLGLCLVCNSAGFDSDINEMSIFLEKLFVRAIQELWQWWSRLLRVVVDTEEKEAVVMVLAIAVVVGTMAEAVVEAVTTVDILGFCKGLPNKLSLKNIEKVTRRAQEQFQMVLEEKSRLSLFVFIFIFLLFMFYFLSLIFLLL